MYELVSHVVEGIFSATGTNIAILITVALHAAIDTCKKPKASEIKLSFVDQQGIINILLNDKCAVSIFLRRTSNYRLNFSNCFHNCDALTSIAILTRLYDPSVLWYSKLLVNLFYGFLVVGFNLTGIIFLHDATIIVTTSCCFLFEFSRCNIFLILLVLGDCLFYLFIALFKSLLKLVVVVGELAEFWVIHT